MTDPDLTWTDGVPVATRFGDPYYALSGGLAETRHVFLAGNALPDRWQDIGDFHIAELGFGTGLNFLAALALWREIAPDTATLHFTSFEAYPLPRDDMRRALAAWPSLPMEELLDQWPLTGPVQIGHAMLEVIVGDANQTLPRWGGLADAWFLDGFAPARNPGMWEETLLRAVFSHTRPGGSFATYTAAGHVRRALAEAGFTVTRQPGFGRKRHMAIGSRPDRNS